MRTRRRRGQSAVELMIMAPLLVLVIVALMQLWSVCFGATNAHLRAREAALHGTTYLSGRTSGVSANAPFSGRNYKKATFTTFSFSGSAEDTSIAGVDSRGQTLRARAVIRSF
jgi:hypothetical protein